MIGNPDDAAYAATHPQGYLLSDFGCSRTVYLIGGVVYKVNRDQYNTNFDETIIAKSLKDYLPEGFAIPEMTMHGDVLAMEYIHGEPTGICTDRELGMECSHAQYNEECMSPEFVETITGWDDPSFGNAIIEYETGITYLIDIA